MSISTPRFWPVPANDEIQLDLFPDHGSNVALYPKFQEYFRAKQTPLMAAWGRNDPFFLPPSAEAFKRDNPNAEIHFSIQATSRWKHTTAKSSAPFATS